MVSLVKCGTFSSPGIGGIIAREPVATTILRASTWALSLATVWASTKRAASRITVTPRPSKRAWLSTGAMLAMVAWTWAITAAKSMLTPLAVTPRWPLWVASCAALAAAISALDGTQP